MKSPMLLWKTLATELGSELGVDTSKDFETVLRRCEYEGEKSFLTITLPKIGKALERGLETGLWSSIDLPFFGRSKGLPRFLGGFLELVFARETGVLLDSPSIDAIRAIRQLSGLFGKVFEVCDDRKVITAMKDWIETDQEVGVSQSWVSPAMLADFEKAALAIWSRPLSLIDRKVAEFQITPRHSSGSNADGRKGNTRWQFVEWTDRLESVFPFVDYAVPSHRYWHLADKIRYLNPSEERPSRVIAVPKTAEKPRIISMEPSYMQYMQQGLSRELMSALEDPSAIYRNFIRLREREHNQLAAQTGSLYGQLATLDLSEASDRLSYLLVMQMFKRFPNLRLAVDACRTRCAEVSDLGVIRLNKFAPMGSALTFPVQTMVFATLVFMGIAKSKNISVGKALNAFSTKVRVFGDDIVVPKFAVESVIEHLTAYGLKVNQNKSFWNGKFRESCGGDFYDGQDVSYVKVRSWLPMSLRDVEEIEACVSLRNRFYEHGLWQTASWLDDELELLLRFYPTTAKTSPMLGRHTYLEPHGDKIDTRLHTPVSKGYVVSRTLPKSHVDGTDALLKWFIEEHDDMPVSADERFERAGRPQHATLKLRWGSVA